MFSELCNHLDERMSEQGLAPGTKVIEQGFKRLFAPLLRQETRGVIESSSDITAGCLEIIECLLTPALLCRFPAPGHRSEWLPRRSFRQRRSRLAASRETPQACTPGDQRHPPLSAKDVRLPADDRKTGHLF